MLDWFFGFSKPKPLAPPPPPPEPEKATIKGSVVRYKRVKTRVGIFTYIVISVKEESGSTRNVEVRLYYSYYPELTRPEESFEFFTSTKKGDVVECAYQVVDRFTHYTVYSDTARKKFNEILAFKNLTLANNEPG